MKRRKSRRSKRSRSSVRRTSKVRANPRGAIDVDDEFDLESEMESGIVLSESRGGAIAVKAENKYVGRETSMHDALMFAAQWMHDKQYWPNVFYVNDHGNVDLLALTPTWVKGKLIKVRYRTVRGWV